MKTSELVVGAVVRLNPWDDVEDHMGIARYRWDSMMGRDHTIDRVEGAYTKIDGIWFRAEHLLLVKAELKMGAVPAARCFAYSCFGEKLLLGYKVPREYIDFLGFFFSGSLSYYIGVDGQIGCHRNNLECCLCDESEESMTYEMRGAIDRYKEWAQKQQADEPQKTVKSKHAPFLSGPWLERFAARKMGNPLAEKMRFESLARIRVAEIAAATRERDLAELSKVEARVMYRGTKRYEQYLSLVRCASAVKK